MTFVIGKVVGKVVSKKVGKVAIKVILMARERVCLKLSLSK
jgi:hypothetical protein